MIDAVLSFFPPVWQTGTLPDTGFARAVRNASDRLPRPDTAPRPAIATIGNARRRSGSCPTAPGNVLLRSRPVGPRRPAIPASPGWGHLPTISKSSSVLLFDSATTCIYRANVVSDRNT